MPTDQGERAEEMSPYTFCYFANLYTEFQRSQVHILTSYSSSGVLS